MRTKDQILLEQAYSKILEGFYSNDHNDSNDGDYDYDSPSPHKVTIEDQVSIPSEDGGEYWLEAEVEVSFFVNATEEPSWDSPGGGGEIEGHEYEWDNVKIFKTGPDGEYYITPQKVGEEQYKNILNKLIEAGEKYADDEVEKKVYPHLK